MLSMFVSPMLLQKSDYSFDDDAYISELKLDGVRLILSKWDDRIRLFSRHKNEITARFPELIDLDIPNGTVLDGEFVVSDEQGRPNFEATMQRYMSSKSQLQAQYCVFDIIYFNGKKVTELPLLQRKELLNDVLPPHSFISPVKWLSGNGLAYFDLVKQQGLEGIVLKKAHSKYQIDTRSKDWLKVINYQYKSVLITGLRKEKFGLSLSFSDGSYAGLMEYMPPKERNEFYKNHRVISENENYKFIEPIEVIVKFRNLTKDGKLRIPSFAGWCE